MSVPSVRGALIAVLAALFAANAQSPRVAHRPHAASGWPLNLEIRQQLGSDSAGHIAFEIVARNLTDDPIYLHLERDASVSPPSSIFDVRVTDGNGKLIWSWLSQTVRTRMVIGTAELRVLPAHGATSWSCRWDLMSSNGATIVPGKYFVQGILPVGNDTLRTAKEPLVRKL